MVSKTINGFRQEGVDYRGFLYFGLMLIKNQSKWRPNVLEYNVRMGDPEAQVIIPRIINDVYPHLLSCARGNLSALDTITWDDRTALCVVMAHENYCTKRRSENEEKIQGIDKIIEFCNRNSIDENDVMIFHAGTKAKGFLTIAGKGRNLGITVLGKNIEDAQQKANKIAGYLKTKNQYLQFRTDIGNKGKTYEKTG